jgi:hypothetical protein|tara:strand:+ start:1037 stop:1189 length:153 start_codon:yes stop_codon:yes gene_type:complete
VAIVDASTAGAVMTPLHHIIPNEFSPLLFPYLEMHARYTAVAALFAKTRA